MSRTFLRRALAAASTTALVTGALFLGAAPPATAEDSSACPFLGSSRLFTATDANGDTFELWLYRPTTGSAIVCFRAGALGGGAVVVRTGVTGSVVPAVTWSITDYDCPVLLDVSDPVDLLTQFAASLSNPYDVCIGVWTDQAVRVTVTWLAGGEEPEHSVWLDPGTPLAEAWCSLGAPNEMWCREANDAGQPIRVLPFGPNS